MTGYSCRLVLLVISYIILTGGVQAQIIQNDATRVTESATADRQIDVFFFWSPYCPHCKNAGEYLNTLPGQYPWISLHSHNVVHVPESAQLFREMAAMLGQEARSVPSIFVCGQMMVGWDSPHGIGARVLSIAQACRQQDRRIPEQSTGQLQSSLFGTIKPEDYSLPLFTLIVAGLDAFNPCAFFVLLFLLSLLVHARSRIRMLLIGGIFVLISGLVYFVFMAAWLNLFLIIGNIGWITLLAGLIAVIIGLLGIKDFLVTFRGPSLSISEQDKPKLFGRIRSLLTIDNTPALIAGTVMLALAANTYELLCTAGFPMVYTRTLTLHELDSVTYYSYLLLYNLIYIIPLMVIVVLFTVTMGARKLTVNQGRLLKLLSGSMMLGLGLVLLFRPELLNSFYTGIVLLLFALSVTMIARILIQRSTI